MTDIDLLWQIMTYYDRLWHILTYYDILWHIWQNLTDFERLWQIMTDYDDWQLTTDDRWPNYCSFLLVFVSFLKGQTENTDCILATCQDT